MLWMRLFLARLGGRGSQDAAAALGLFVDIQSAVTGHGR
jgi:hypothetical protein